MDLSKPWEIHSKQDKALQLVAADPTLRVFAVQPVIRLDCSQGGRKFIACTTAKFWWEYSKMIRTKYPRHYYEVIVEDKPCHMYFDLEFLKNANLNLDGNKLVDDLIEFVCEKIYRDFEIKCSKQNVLRLDSSTEEKFSQHLIFHIPNAAFKSNFDVGNFVSALCGDTEVVNCLIVHGENDSKKRLIVDQAVYTKNRHFRLFQSSKRGSKAILLRSDDCCYEFTSSTATGTTNGLIMDNEAIFLASLITNINIAENSEIRLLSVENLEKKHHRKNVKDPSACQPSVLDLDGGVFNCPELDDFIVAVATEKDKTPCYFSGTFFDEQNATVRYSLRGNRYCRNIQRAHKSNNVYYVAYLLEKVVMQMCYDRESCRHFCSSPIRFPKSLGRIINVLVKDILCEEELIDDTHQVDSVVEITSNLKSL